MLFFSCHLLSSLVISCHLLSSLVSLSVYVSIVSSMFTGQKWHLSWPPCPHRGKDSSGLGLVSTHQGSSSMIVENESTWDDNPHTWTISKYRHRWKNNMRIHEISTFAMNSHWWLSLIMENYSGDKYIILFGCVVWVWANPGLAGTSSTGRSNGCSFLLSVPQLRMLKTWQSLVYASHFGLLSTMFGDACMLQNESCKMNINESCDSHSNCGYVAAQARYMICWF